MKNFFTNRTFNFSSFGFFHFKPPYFIDDSILSKILIDVNSLYFGDEPHQNAERNCCACEMEFDKKWLKKQGISDELS